MARTPEFERIKNLPRRVPPLFDVTPIFAKAPGFSLRPLQSAALIEASEKGGLFCPAPVGAGKALIALLLPVALDAERAVILTEAKLKRALTNAAHDFYGKYLKIPFDRFQIVSYPELSSARKAGILEEIRPDAVICDEAHCLKNIKSARTIRFLRYAKYNRERCKFAFLSGTMSRKSLRDFAHLMDLALGTGAPVPFGYYELLTWCGALDINPDFPTRPGMLRVFCRGKETIREGFQRRLFDTPGVIGGDRGDIGTSLVIQKLPMKMPLDVQRLMSGVEKNWKIGDKEMKLALEQSQAMQQLGSGFFYRWIWPNGKDEEWLTARAEYFSEVREKLKHARPGMDSPFLLWQAAARYWRWKEAGGEKPDRIWPSEKWRAWEAVKGRVKPKTETVWVNDFLVDAAILWAEKQDRGAIIWYSYRAVGERLAEKGGFPLYGSGGLAETATAPVIVCSIRAQGTGQNLQHHYAANFLTGLSPNATIFQQLVGRTHRPGQEEDEVLVVWPASPENEDSMARIKEEAVFQEEAMGEKQKVLFATHL